MKIKYLSIAIVLFHLSCQTVQVVNPIPIPANVSKKFSLCFPKDGGLEMTAYKDGRGLPKILMDWISYSKDFWKAEFSDPLGRKILKITANESSIEFSGRFKNRLPGIVIDENGFIEVDGHQIGILASEVPCLLQFTLPHQWSTRVISEKISNGVTAFDIRSDNRVITARFFDDYNYNTDKICTQIEWSSFWGLKKTSLEWCKQIKAGKRQATLTGPTGLILSWTDDGYENS